MRIAKPRACDTVASAPGSLEKAVGKISFADQTVLQKAFTVSSWAFKAASALGLILTLMDYSGHDPRPMMRAVLLVFSDFAITVLDLMVKSGNITAHFLHLDQGWGSSAGLVLWWLVANLVFDVVRISVMPRPKIGTIGYIGPGIGDLRG